MKRMHKLLALLLGILTVVSLLAACADTTQPQTDSQTQAGDTSSTEETQQPADNTAETGEPTRFTYMRGVWGPATFTPGGEYEQTLKELANVEVEVQIVPIGEYDAKVKTVAASGSLPDMMMAYGPTDAYWRDLENQGAFAPLDEYLEQYPALKSICDDSMWEMLRNPDDGHIYFMPNTCVAEMPFFIYYRQDWFEELGIEEPTTIAELEAVLETIKEKMPDVTPMTVAAGATAWLAKDLGTAFGATVSGWTLDENGNLIPDHMDEETIDFAFWLQDMKERGLLDEEADVNPDLTFGEQKFKTSRAAVICGVFNQFTGYYTSLMENDPDAKIGIIGPLTGPDGTQGGTRISFPMDRGYYFSTTAEDLDGIMAFLNWSLTDGNDFRKWGVEGKTYTVDENGVKHSIPDTEREADWVSSQIEPLTFVHVPEDNFSWDDYQANFDAIGCGDYLEYFKEKWEAYCEVKYYDYRNPTTISATNNEIGAMLTESYLSSYWYSGIITNPAITREEFDGAVQQWLDAGGQQIIDEFNAAQPDKSEPTYG